MRDNSGYFVVIVGSQALHRRTREDIAAFVLNDVCHCVDEALQYTYLPALVMRTNVVDVVKQGFNLYQKVTGLPRTERMFNVAKHASLPVITLYPASLAQGFGGLVLVETVFNWPGIGYTLVQAVFASDYPVLQFVFFLVAAFIIIANFLVDIIYGMLDPRIQLD